MIKIEKLEANEKEIKSVSDPRERLKSSLLEKLSGDESIVSFQFFICSLNQDIR